MCRIIKFERYELLPDPFCLKTDGRNIRGIDIIDPLKILLYPHKIVDFHCHLLFQREREKRCLVKQQGLLIDEESFMKGEETERADRLSSKLE